MRRIRIERNWVEQLTVALDEAAGVRTGNGFHGIWRSEWRRSGAWIQADQSDPFDVAPFRQGIYSSGRTVDELTWTKPVSMTVGAFDLYWFYKSDMGRWQYRVDDGPWTNINEPSEAADNKLHRVFVGERVRSQVAIRGHDGAEPCVAPIAGISVWTSAPPESTGNVVHNLGHQNQLLAAFCRPSAGDPLALLDDLRPDLITVLFSNDVGLHEPTRFGETIRGLVQRVSPYADVLLVSPFEQRPPRRVTDAVTNRASNVLTSETALFLATDRGSRISGTNIAAGTRITSVQSTNRARMTDEATGSAAHGELTVQGKRSATMQAEYRSITKVVADAMGCAFLDLYGAWAATVGEGWDAAWSAGLMHDGLHPTQLGHDDIAARVKNTLGL